jgi:hypothetical protein
MIIVVIIVSKQIILMIEKKDIEHTDEEIVNILFWDFPKIGEKILEYLDNNNE